MTYLMALCAKLDARKFIEVKETVGEFYTPSLESKDLFALMCLHGHASTALMVAFEALDAMREKAPVGEEAVYRSLISACGRCGNSEKALSVVEVRYIEKQYRYWTARMTENNLKAKQIRHESRHGSVILGQHFRML